MVNTKSISLFSIVLVIVSIIEAYIIFYTHIEHPSQKAVAESKRIYIHLTSKKESFSKQVSHTVRKPVEKPLPKQKPIKKIKSKIEPKSKFESKSKHKLKPVQKKATQKPKIESQKKQSKPIQKSQPKRVSTTPKKSNNTSQKIDHFKIDAIKTAYLKEIRELIEFNKYYPRSAKRMHQRGVVEIEFTIEKSGEISNIAIVKGCKYNILNRAAKRTLEKIGKFKPLPNEFKTNFLTLRVPINYILY